MGTKNEPGAYDCHAKAEDDEELFTLLARDPLAHGLVELWGHLRNGALREAVYCFGYLVAQASKIPFEPKDEAKVGEAYGCAVKMREWHAEHRG